jgi:hypothetical protein
MILRAFQQILLLLGNFYLFMFFVEYIRIQQEQLLDDLRVAEGQYQITKHEISMYRVSIHRELLFFFVLLRMCCSTKTCISEFCAINLSSLCRLNTLG